MSLDKTFKPVIALNNDRFAIWKIINEHKNEEDIMITFNGIETNEKYAAVRLHKLLELLYNNKKENNK